MDVKIPSGTMSITVEMADAPVIYWNGEEWIKARRLFVEGKRLNRVYFNVHDRWPRTIDAMHAPLTLLPLGMQSSK